MAEVSNVRVAEGGDGEPEIVPWQLGDPLLALEELPAEVQEAMQTAAEYTDAQEQEYIAQGGEPWSSDADVPWDKDTWTTHYVTALECLLGRIAVRQI